MTFEFPFIYWLFLVLVQQVLALVKGGEGKGWKRRDPMSFFKDSQFYLLPSRASHSTVQQTLMFPVSVLGDNFGLQTIGLLGMQALQCSELKLFIYLPTKDMLHPCRKFPYFSVYRYRKNNIIRKITYVKINN